MKTIEEEMNEQDEKISEIVGYIAKLLTNSRDKYYDALVYFGYIVCLIKLFGEDDVVTFSKEFMDNLTSSIEEDKFRVDQETNEDGSVTIKLVKIEKEGMK